MSEDKRKNLRDVLDEMDKYFEDFEKEIEQVVRNGVFGENGAKPFVAGFSFNMGPEGKPSFQMFGNNPVHMDGSRAPMSEQILDTKNESLKLLLEMPGVEKSDIKVDTTEDTALITAERGDRKYRTELRFKAPVKQDSGKAEYKNGMLEISFSLKDKANKGYRRVDVV